MGKGNQKDTENMAPKPVEIPRRAEYFPFLRLQFSGDTNGCSASGSGLDDSNFKSELVTWFNIIVSRFIQLVTPTAKKLLKKYNVGTKVVTLP